MKRRLSVFLFFSLSVYGNYNEKIFRAKFKEQVVSGYYTCIASGQGSSFTCILKADEDFSFSVTALDVSLPNDLIPDDHTCTQLSENLYLLDRVFQKGVYFCKIEGADDVFVMDYAKYTGQFLEVENKF